jgi:FKBP-type peptidyl-prolyl cis-trans isomerase FkpA
MKYILTSLLALILFISCNSNLRVPKKTDYTAENEKEIQIILLKTN